MRTSLSLRKGWNRPIAVAAAADAGDEQIGQAFLALQNLAACLDADDAVEIAHHHRERMRAERGTEDVVRGAHVRDPVAHGFVHGFLERGLAGGDGDDFGPEKAHAGDIERLALHIDLAHVDDAFDAKARAHGGGGDAVLASAGFGDDALFAETLGEQDLAEGVVDLVSAGVQQILALEVDFGTAELFGPAFGEIERRGTADVFVEQAVELFWKAGSALAFS
jgi:hypothetical protein